ncbi:MAG TPA: 2-phospho-L-lactate guanylyltransferase [Actinobacteria bacterium]|nr:2-phospho-L-lactate guanylyltransferase [Actinomycetota bacterium]HCP62770.1 2-phospho-L-lactate guanylyltransferase [Actinomycetota bacterium]
MQVIAVPVKSLERTKTRLAPVLSPLERAVLTLAMLEDVLDACLAQETWEVWVVSPDDAVGEMAARRGAVVVDEQGGSLLSAVREVEAKVTGATGRLAVLLGDLPLLSAEDLTAGLAVDAPVVAAPAFSDGGTNLLVRRPATVIPARFGRTSFAKHRWAARRARVECREVRSDGLAFDLDRPADLARMLVSGRPGRTLSTCLEFGLPERLASGERRTNEGA